MATRAWTATTIANLLLGLGASLVTGGCAAEAPSEEVSTEEVNGASTPIDIFTYRYEIEIDDPNEGIEGCEREVYFEANTHGPGPIDKDTVSIRRFQHLTSLEITPRCRSAANWSTKISFAFDGESLDKTPGPLKEVRLRRTDRERFSGNVRLRMGLQKIASDSHVEAGHCPARLEAGMAKYFVGTRTFISPTRSEYGDAGEDYQRTLVLGGDAMRRVDDLAFVENSWVYSGRNELVRETPWVTVCQPESQGDGVSVAVELVEKDLFRDDHYEADAPKRIAAGQSARFENSAIENGELRTHRSFVMVLR